VRAIALFDVPLSEVFDGASHFRFPTAVGVLGSGKRKRRRLPDRSGAAGRDANVAGRLAGGAVSDW